MTAAAAMMTELLEGRLPLALAQVAGVLVDVPDAPVLVVDGDEEAEFVWMSWLSNLAGRRWRTSFLMPSIPSPSGPTVPLPHDSRPIAFFNQMFGEAFFDRMAEATNANAATRRPPLEATVDVTASSDPHWNATTAAEMRAFVGLNIAMGFKDLPEYRDYWTEEPILHDDYVANIMSRRRYEKLVEYFHCSMPAEETADDKLTKVRPFITLCTENFKRCFAPC